MGLVVLKSPASRLRRFSLLRCFIGVENTLGHPTAQMARTGALEDCSWAIAVGKRQSGRGGSRFVSLGASACLAASSRVGTSQAHGVALAAAQAPRTSDPGSRVRRPLGHVGEVLPPRPSAWDSDAARDDIDHLWRDLQLPGLVLSGLLRPEALPQRGREPSATQKARRRCSACSGCCRLTVSQAELRDEAEGLPHLCLRAA